MDTSVNWTFNMIDNVTGPTKNMVASQQDLSASANVAKKSVDSQNISFIAQVAAVHAVYSGMNRMTSSLSELGMISDSTAASLGKVNAGIGLVAGGFSLLKGAVQIVKMLTAAEIGLAAVESFRSVLQSPGKMALVGAGIGLAAGVGATLLASSGASGPSTTVNQTINYGGAGSAADQRSAARDSFEIMGGF